MCVQKLFPATVYNENLITCTPCNEYFWQYDFDNFVHCPIDSHTLACCNAGAFWPAEWSTLALTHFAVVKPSVLAFRLVGLRFLFCHFLTPSLATMHMFIDPSRWFPLQPTHLRTWPTTLNSRQRSGPISLKSASYVIASFLNQTWRRPCFSLYDLVTGHLPDAG